MKVNVLLLSTFITHINRILYDIVYHSSMELARTNELLPRESDQEALSDVWANFRFALTQCHNNKALNNKNPGRTIYGKSVELTGGQQARQARPRARTQARGTQAQRRQVRVYVRVRARARVRAPY